MRPDKRKVQHIIDYVSFRQESFNETVVRTQLEEALGSDLSDELNHLRDSGLIELEEHSEQSYVILSDTDQQGLDETMSSLEDRNVSFLDEEELLDGGMVIDSPEKYVATLAPFGERIQLGSTPVLSQDEIERQVGENLDFQLSTLTEWDYLTEIEPTHEEIRSIDSTMYRLKIEDNEVKGDAFHSEKHISECYDGSIEMFLDRYSEADSESLSKRGVNFYRDIG